VLALLDHGDQVAVEQPGQVCAGGGRGDAGAAGQLAGGQCPALDECDQHRRAGRLAHQRGGRCDRRIHASTVTEQWLA
jgi:hypothetical protein